MGQDTDWARMEIVEFEHLRDIWAYAKDGAKLAGESGLIIVQAIPDFHAEIRDIALDPRQGDRKARRVTRRLKSVVNHFTAIKNDFERIPGDMMKIYAEEIDAARRKKRKKIDLSNA